MIRLKFDQAEAQKMIKRLENLGEKRASSIARSAVNAGAKVISKEAKSRAPKGEMGLLKQSMKHIVKTRWRENGVAFAIVGADKSIEKINPKRKTKKGGAWIAKPYKYFHLVHNSFIHLRGLQPTRGNPFLKRAVEASGDRAGNEFVKKMEEMISKWEVK